MPNPEDVRKLADVVVDSRTSLYLYNYADLLEERQQNINILAEKILLNEAAALASKLAREFYHC